MIYEFVICIYTEVCLDYRYVGIINNACNSCHKDHSDFVVIDLGVK